MHVNAATDSHPVSSAKNILLNPASVAAVVGGAGVRRIGVLEVQRVPVATMSVVGIVQIQGPTTFYVACSGGEVVKVIALQCPANTCVDENSNRGYVVPVEGEVFNGDVTNRIGCASNHICGTSSFGL